MCFATRSKNKRLTSYPQWEVYPSKHLEAYTLTSAKLCAVLLCSQAPGVCNTPSEYDSFTADGEDLCALKRQIR